MPLITLKPPRRPSSNTQSPSQSISPPSIDTSGFVKEQSPEAPPASPLTPVLKASTLSSVNTGDASQPFATFPPTTTQQHAGITRPLPQLIDRPAPLPFSGEDSSDAIALRAAISSLQFQRAKAQKDLRTLEELKKQAVEHPDEWMQHTILAESNPTKARQPGEKWIPPPNFDHDSDGDSDSEDNAIAGAEKGPSIAQGSKPSFSHVEEIPDSQQTPIGSSFGSLFASQQQYAQESARSSRPVTFLEAPGLQDVVRCPPIEWSKYHIVGDSLDTLHKAQQSRPGGGGGYQGRESVIAAAYNPFVDKFDGDEKPLPPQGERKDSGASAAEQRRKSSRPPPGTD